jgi:hypothetical protein
MHKVGELVEPVAGAAGPLRELIEIYEAIPE